MIKSLFLILFTISIQAQNVWYVNRDTPQRDNPTGQDGKSWATAWQDLDSVGYWNDGNGVNWNVISAGDTIYISGGADSTRYTPKDHVQGECVYGVTMVYHNDEIYTFADSADDKTPVVITKAWHANHNGEVYFMTNGLNQQRAFDYQNVSNVKFVNLNFMNLNHPDSSTGSIISTGQGSNTECNDSLLTFEDCYFYTKGGGAMLGVSPSKTTFRNCIFDMEESDYEADNDAMGLAGGRGGLTLDNNLIIFRNGSMTTGAHRDVLQFSNFGQRDTVERLTTIISNNLVIDTRPEGIGWNAVIYSSGPYANQTFYVYNNIFVSQKQYSNEVPIFMYHPDCPPAPYACDSTGGLFGNYREEFGVFDQSLHLLNNTFIMKGTGGGPITSVWYDTLVIKNNIMIVDTANTAFYSLNGADGFPYTNYFIDYNIYAEKNGISASFFGMDNAINNTYTEWLAFESNTRDANSDTMDALDITFIDKYDTNKVSYYTTTGRDLGVDLSATYPFLATDAVGNPRSGTWDIGALEYDTTLVDSTPSNVAFNTDYLNAELNTEYTGNIYDLAGFDSGYVRINRGWYNIDGNAWKDSSQHAIVYPLDDIAVRDTSSSLYSTTQSIILTIGDASDTWTVTTKSDPTASRKSLKSSNGKLVFTSDGKIIIKRGSAYVPSVGEPDETAPNPPTSFVATGGTSSTQFQTSWTNPTASDLASIRYYEGSSNDTTTMAWIVSLSASTGHLRTGRTANATYWCAVKAVDDSGNVSYFSNVDSATTLETPEGGIPLQNLNFIYLSQSTAGHLYDHHVFGDAGTTTMPDEVDAYNLANGLEGSNACVITKLPNDEYPADGDMIWNWDANFQGTGTDYIVDDFLTDTTYSIFQITYGFACGALSYYGWTEGGASDTAVYPTGLIGNNFKYYSRRMLAVMEQYPDKYFVWWTLYPPGTGYPIPDDMRMASDFGKWMTDTLAAGLDSYGAFPENVMIFDIRTLLDSAYYLPDSYADGPNSTDEHPNAAAASYIAPIYIQQVFDNARAYRKP